MEIKLRVHVTRNNEVIADATGDICNAFLGKDEDAIVVLRGWRIGRKQVQFSLTDQGALRVIDGGGMSPMRVNGRQVNEHSPVLPHDQIEIGEYRIHARVLRDDLAGARKNISPKFASEEEPVPSVESAPLIQTDQGMQLRGLMHRRLIDAMDLRRVNVSRMADAELRLAVGKLIEEILETDPSFEPLKDVHEQLKDVVLNEVVGLGPLEALIGDDTVTEIMVNRHSEIYVERKGKLIRSEITFSNDSAVVAAIERIVSPLGRRIDEASPMVDARLKDGSRVNAVIPPLAIKGPSITIRKFAKRKLHGEDLINFGTANAEMLEFLQTAVEHRANIVISGGTGSGKTTLLNILSGYISEDERIVTVEDAAELQLSQPNLVSLEARPANIEGRGSITIRDLVKNCLRMRPDRIVVGECRGGEAVDMLQAMNTGHDGSMTTAHANSPRDCLSRLEVMTLMSGLDIPVQAIREQVSSAVDIIVQQIRFSCGSRRITHITEVTGIEGDIVSMQDIFRFVQDGFDEKGLVKGKFQPTGHIPKFYQDMLDRGISVDIGIFSDE